MDDRTKDQLDRGREHYAAGEFDKAEQCLDPLARNGHPFADVYGMLGVIHHAKGRVKQARTMLEEATRLNPGYTEAAMNLAVVLNETGEYDAAKDVYRRMLATRKGQPPATGDLDPFVKSKISNMHAAVGQAYAQSGLHVEAAREYERALELCPTFVDIRTRLGVAYREAGNFEASQKEFERAKRDHPRLSSARLQLGMTHHAAGRHEDAEKEWKELLVLDPGNKFAKMYLGLLKT